jgi:putative membrane-bound dehydrogenase-like protein
MSSAHDLPKTVFLLLALISTASLLAQEVVKPPIPHAQDRPPNDPRDPATAARLMTVPDGFTVEVVAAEPDIVNPVAMAIDERGRFWITESLEYPRREPGPGKDRVKILEDTDGDGKVDKTTVFLDGLNIPSGIAVGHGGVWIANAPDILFVRDTDGDGSGDSSEVVVTGFGRADTHELPNSLTWGPDGWLYGLNGVFNHSHVKYAKENPNFQQDHPGWPLTCAMFRIHPRTREFQVFCEGTSNPWGIAFNEEGDAFVSACVIDHLWHLIETGYYHRQGGPYPPFTWKLESIVNHKHQKAAYCGIHYFDSDAWPEAYRRKLYMGNIHGGCINVDRIEQAGPTFQGFGEPDLLTANDAWFMPVVQKTGPDGSLYILDWYDRYHCYQDANRDPAGIDRLKGRLYRIRYKNTPRVPKSFDLASETDEQLVDRLGAKNDFIRDTAQRLLQERNTESIGKLLLERLRGPGRENFSVDHRRRMFMTLGGLSVAEADRTRDWDPHDPDPVIRSWRVRFMGEHPTDAPNLHRLRALPGARTNDREQVEIVIAAAKLLRSRYTHKVTENDIDDLFHIFVERLAGADQDGTLAHIVWQNLQPYLETHADLFVIHLHNPAIRQNAALMAMMPRIINRLLGRRTFDPKPVAKLIELLAVWQPDIAGESLAQISARVQNQELTPDQLAELKIAIGPQLHVLLGGSPASVLFQRAAFLGASWNDAAGIKAVRTVLVSDKVPSELRLAALNSLIAANDAGLVDTVATMFDSKLDDPKFKSQILASLSKLDDPEVAGVVLARYQQLEPDLQPRAIELLTQRAVWAKPLLLAIGEKKVPASAINVNQARRLKGLRDEELTKLIAVHWGQVREGRDPDREKYINEMRQLIRKSPGDPFAGERGFKKVCGHCHKIYGEGADVGPDITLNGRNDFNQLLSNVFDPSLVIGAGYRSYTVITHGGRVLNGLLAEESPQRVILKVQGGKQEVIARADIDEMQVSEISLMPEQLEKQLTQQEIVDLFAFLTLDKHPSDASGRQLAGAGEVAAKETTNPVDYSQVVKEVLPGFATTASGELGIGILKEHYGRTGVLRTHPVSPEKPCVLFGTFPIPPGKKTSLLLDVSHDPQGDWELVVRANGQQLTKAEIGPKTCNSGWATIRVDLTKFAGQEIRLELQNVASGWAWEFGYWGGVRFVSE